ncbi:MAG: 2-C-methyl-D-erythritol 2,4-cyclodiphosphate synthase [Candidatus Cloacimonadota bacterium]|nr:MAG: 2-C-methyl-D-erythritol 2,4-cyclodiphosphate synthase [Candidatus Cloacimonadota bacterium]
MRIGYGYDVHKLTEGRPLILGGINIPYEKGLLGHSDADVLVHAVADAILGALALGDIGQHFPDTDSNYKNADSMELLRHVCELMKEKGYKLGNMDSTVCAQRPKLKDFIPEIRKRFAEVIGCDISQVSVKATTEEKMGITGNGQGMTAHAVVLLEKITT